MNDEIGPVEEQSSKDSQEKLYSVRNQSRIRNHSITNSDLVFNTSSTSITCWLPSKFQPYITTLGFVIFTIILMTTGILIVIFRTSKQSNSICPFTFKTIVTNSKEQNSRPIAIAFGDFNNDNVSDIVVANSAIDNIGIFIGDGNGTFLNPYFYSTGLGSYPCSVAVSDFNNDNQMDIVVANHHTHTIDIFLGNGNGTFTIQMSYTTGSSRPLHVAVSDFNNDNRTDIVVVNYGSNTIDIFFANDSGYFKIPPVTYSTGYDSIPYHIAIADFNGDTWLDIVVANYGTSTISILFGYGNGTLANQMTFFTGAGSHPYNLAVADFDNDNYLDTVVAYSGTGNIGIFLGYRNGTFASQHILPIGIIGPLHIAVSDFNNDTKLDIAIAIYNTDVVQIFLGFGNGTFANQISYSTGFGSYPFSIVVGDFNSDCQSDIVVTNNGTNNVGVLLGYDPAALQNQITYTTNPESLPSSVAVDYLNDDNHLDFVVNNYGNNNVEVFLGLGDGTFATHTTYSTGTGSGPFAVAIGDVNNDNQMDIIVANYVGNSIGILFGFGNGTFANIMTYSTGIMGGSYSVAIGDFNHDNWLDIVVANNKADNVGVFFGLGNGKFANQSTLSTGSGSASYFVNVADFDNDTHLDIIVTNSAGNNVGVFYGFGNGTFAQQITYSTGSFSRPYAVAFGDFNNDDRLDLAVANRHSDTVGILLGLGSRIFGTVTAYKTGTYFTPFSVAIGDFNNDNRLDIAVANRDDHSLGIFLGFGDGTFGAQTTYSTGVFSRPYCVTTGNFNHDGRLDFIVANRNTSNVGIFIGYNYGALMDQTTYSTGSAARPISVALGDFNSDNKTDIVIANFGTNTIGILIQYNDRAFRNQTTYSTGSHSNPNSVAVGDFNNDNRLDIVSANYASDTIGIFLGFGNGTFQSQITYSTGIYSFPSSVAIADFNNDNRSDIVVTNSNASNIGVFLTNVYTSLATPITYSTGSNSGPYSINLGDFNNDSQLDIVVANYGTSNIGIFFGFDNGSFAKQITYSTGSDSGPQSVAIGDFNNDNRLDIVVANYKSTTVGILLGLGDGTFADQITYSTGTDSSPYSVNAGDFDDDENLDIVVANYGTSNIGIFFGFDNGSFAKQITYSTGSDSGPQSVAIGDFNNDNRLDIVVANYKSANIGIFLGFGNRSFAEQFTYSTDSGSGPSFVAIDDLNNDNQLDIIVANYDGDTVGIFLNFGNGMFANQTTYSTGLGTHPWSVSSGDFNNDNRLDIVAVTYYGNTVDIFLGFGDGTFGSKMVYSIGASSLSPSLVLADFNDDKLLDIAVANSGTSDISIFFGYCCEPFRNQIIYDTGNDSRPSSVIVGNLNNDNYFDIVVANYGGNNIGVMLGYDNGSFAKQTIYSVSSDSLPYAVAIGDFNDDGCQDITVASHNTNYIAILFGIGNGSFTNHTLYWIDTTVRMSAVVVGDFNNDHRLDIAVSNDAINNIGILYGYGNGAFENIKLYSTDYNSWPCSLEVGDLNNDTQLDIVVANQGKNNVEILSKFC